MEPTFPGEGEPKTVDLRGPRGMDVPGGSPEPDQLSVGPELEALLVALSEDEAPAQPDIVRGRIAWLRGIISANGRRLRGAGGRVLSALWLGPVAVGIWLATKVARRVLRHLDDDVLEVTVRAALEVFQFVTGPATMLVLVALLGASIFVIRRLAPGSRLGRAVAAAMRIPSGGRSDTTKPLVGTPTDASVWGEAGGAMSVGVAKLPSEIQAFGHGDALPDPGVSPEPSGTPQVAMTEMPDSRRRVSGAPAGPEGRTSHQRDDDIKPPCREADNPSNSADGPEEGHLDLPGSALG